jgi:hypothetical protein
MLDSWLHSMLHVDISNISICLTQFSARIVLDGCSAWEVQLSSDVHLALAAEPRGYRANEMHKFKAERYASENTFVPR